MPNFIVLSRQHAKAFKCDQPWAAISVSTEIGDFPELSEENRVGLLRLNFWDIANPRLLEDNDQRMVGKLFSKDQAEQILKFIDDVWDKTCTILVHCEAGISRSPAIAAACEYYKNGKEASLPYFNRFNPNQFVYKTILEAAFGGHSAELKEAATIVSDSVYNVVHEEAWDCKS